jgi:enterobacterial common antigen flippase
MLGPSDRGFLALIILVPTIATQIVGLGISAALPYFIARDPGAAAGVVRAIRRPTAVQLVVGAAAHGIVAALLFADAGPTVQLAAVISLLIVPGALLQELAIAVLQGMREFRIYNILRLLPVVAYAAGVLVLFLTGAGDLVTVTAVSVASTVAFALLSAASVRARVGPASAPQAFSPILSYGLRGYLSANTVVETYRLDQALIGLLHPPAALGYYVVGMAFTNLPKFIAQSVGIVAYPIIASQPFDEARATTWRYTGLVAITAGIAAGVFIATAEWVVVLFFGEEFAPAVQVTKILLANAFLFAIRRILTDAARGLGLSGRSSIAEAASIVVFAVAVLALGVSAGIERVAIALVISSVSAIVLLAGFIVTARPPVAHMDRSLPERP